MSGDFIQGFYRAEAGAPTQGVFIPQQGDFEWNIAGGNSLVITPTQVISWSFWGKGYIGGPQYAAFIESGNEGGAVNDFEVYWGNAIAFQSSGPYGENTTVAAGPIGSGSERLDPAMYDDDWHHFCGFANMGAYGGNPGNGYLESLRIRSWIDAVEVGIGDPVDDPVIGHCQGSANPAANLNFNSFQFPEFLSGAGSGSPPEGLAYYDLWVGFGQLIDFTNPANVQKFRTTGGFPANLGASGELPTGTSPTIYMTGDATAFLTNRGTGGNAYFTPDTNSNPLLTVVGP